MKLRNFPFFIVFCLTLCITFYSGGLRAQPASSPSTLGDGASYSDAQPRFEIIAATSTTRDALIGDGTPASCTEAALNGALAVGGLITFNCGTAPHSIVFTTSKVLGAASPDITLDGGGKITLDGDETVRLFDITNAARTLTLQNITLIDGRVTGASFDGGAAVRNAAGGTVIVVNSTFTSHVVEGSNAFGGAIYVANNGVLSATSSRFSSNESGTGGAIFTNFGTMNLLGSSFNDNEALTGNRLGGAVALGTGTGNIANSTFINNQANSDTAIFSGPGFPENMNRLNLTHNTFSSSGTAIRIGAFGATDTIASLRNNILTTTGDTNCTLSEGTIIDGGGNLLSGGDCESVTPISTDDPMVGGSVGTPAFLPLREGSPALNVAGNCTYLSTGTNPLFSADEPVTTDQRGAPRPFGAACDVGAFERINVVGTGTAVSCTETALDWALPGGGNVSFDCGILPVTIPITTTKFLTANALDVNLDGLGLVTLDGGNAIQLFRVSDAARTLTLQNMTLTQGNDGGLDGGAVSNNGNLNVVNVTFTNNTAAFGGAIFNNRVANVFRSAFIGNSASGGGGAIVNNSPDDTLNIANSTFTGNTTDATTGLGSAIVAFGFVSITNTTISGNNADALYLYNGTHQLRNVILTDNDLNCDVANPVLVDGGGNVVNGSTCNGITPISTGDPLLGSLEGNPPYFPIGFDSPAKDTVTNCTYLSNGANPLFTNGANVTVDQRGIARPFGAFCDVGAYEFDGTAPTATPTATSTPDSTTTPGATSTPDGTTTPDATSTPDGTTTPGATSTPDTSTNLLLNSSFEAADANKVPESWTQKNPSSDKQVCNKIDRPGKPDKIVARTGSCAYQFKGSVAENSKLEQSVDLTANPVVLGDTLMLGGLYTAKGTVSAKVKVRVKYTDTTIAKVKITATIIAEATIYTALMGDLNVVITGVPASIKVQLQNKGTSGKVIFDDLSLTQTSASLLPLP